MIFFYPSIAKKTVGMFRFRQRKYESTCLSRPVDMARFRDRAHHLGQPRMGEGAHSKVHKSTPMRPLSRRSPASLYSATKMLNVSLNSDDRIQ